MTIAFVTFWDKDGDADVLRRSEKYHFKSVNQKVSRQISMELFVKQLNLQLKPQRRVINRIVVVFSSHRHISFGQYFVEQ